MTKPQKQIRSQEAREHEQILAVRDMYGPTTFSDDDAVALDTVFQLWCRLGVTYPGPRPCKPPLKGPRRGVLRAYEQGWLVLTGLGYEPTIDGILAADELRRQAGFSVRFRPWEEVVREELASSPALVTDPMIIVENRVLCWFELWENRGAHTTTSERGDTSYILLSLADYFCALPVMAFPTDVLAALQSKGTIKRNGSGYELTAAGRLNRKQFWSKFVEDPALGAPDDADA
ncbi:hypothetical protein [Leucobacter aridicollis]|uniref:hypothetical protein n=1 Tax=Leucobacter aridicollis TaxID=283878 RepID=UPI002102C1A7|nr:hypothetical protein [Leucobacter aridicollis]UTX53288.1 hypothetical protein KI794_00520 [Leucobacter aridicollis]